MKLAYRISVFSFFIFIIYLLLKRGDRGSGLFRVTNEEKNPHVNDIFARGNTHYSTFVESAPDRMKREVVLSVVVCGDRVQETLVMIKSAIIFSQDCFLRIIVVAEGHLSQDFNEKLSEWKNLTSSTFSFETRPVSFPNHTGLKWKELFKPCAAQRLFFPSLLSDVDSVLYVDTDVLFLSPLENVWRHFDEMNTTHFAALAPEHEDPHTGWYNRFAKHPFYGKLGVNSGVMLMNLTRMREFKWEDYLVPIFKEYKLMMTWGDQDIINIIFHFHPERLYIYDCTYNYRSDHCMYSSVCKPAESHGVRVLHGSRGTFHGNKQPAFKAIFQAFQELQLGSDPYQYLLLPMETYLKQSNRTNCDKMYSIFLKQLKEFVGDRDYFS